MITWVTGQLAIAEVSDLKNVLIDTETILIDARLFFDNEGQPFKVEGKFFYESIIHPTVFNITKLLRNVIVFCDGGIDRSPFIVANVLEQLYMKECCTLSEAYGMIKEKRPLIIEHYEWVNE